jgi:hypothetical protein
MADWHPILSAREISPGRRYMIDGLGKPYGRICLVRRGDQIGYRADRCDGQSELVGLVGYYRAVMPAAVAVHTAFIRAHGALGAPNGTGIIQGHGLNRNASR